MPPLRPTKIAPPEGRLGVLLPGLGAVATTTIAGALLARAGRARPIGSLTQMGALPEAPPLAGLDQLVFGGWDLFPDSAYAAAAKAEVLRPEHLEPIRAQLEAIVPMPAASFPGSVRRLDGGHVKQVPDKAEAVAQLRADIRRFAATHACDRLVAIWCGSTEIDAGLAAPHETIAAFEAGLRGNHPAIANAQLYAWACLREGVPFANGAPNRATDFPAAAALAERVGVAVAGKDFKTGQTLLKTVLAPGLKARMLGIRGWYSTNILGNRDGQVLADPAACESKRASKLGVLAGILEPERYPDLYADLCHEVRIDYYPPRGDAKEGWDNIDLVGWLGYPMQLKLNFLCRDSILAAPLVLDLALLLDLAQRAGQRGVQDWLGFYFKSPQVRSPQAPAHDLFAQLDALERALVRLHHGPATA